MSHRSRTATLLFIALIVVTTSALAAEVRIGGRVLDPDGSPLADAEVLLLPLADEMEESLAAIEGWESEPSARTITGKNGRFELVAPHAGLWNVRVQAPGHVPLVAGLRPLIEPVELPDATLSVDAGLSLRVEGPQRAPLPGASVRITSERSRFERMGSGWSFPVRGGLTGPDGTVRLPRAGREQVSLSVHAAGFAGRERRGLYGSSARIGLAPAPSRTIEVRSAEGAPAPDVLIATGRRAHPLGRTDPQGRFTLSAPVADRSEIRLLAADGRSAEARLAPPDPEGAPQRMELPDRLFLSGRLIDASSRKAIEGGLVWDRTDPTVAAVTDRAGGFALGGPPLQRMRLTAGAPGYLPAGGTEFQLDDDGRPGPTLVLEPAAAVEGRVVDESGEPVAGASLTVAVRRQPGMMRIEIGGGSESPRARSTQTGGFRLAPLDPENGYDVKVEAEGFAPAENAVTGLEPYENREGLRVVMTRGRAITGRIVDLEGRGVGDALLKLTAAPDSSGSGMLVMRESAGDGAGLEGFSDAEGHFELAGIAPGRFDLEIRRAGYARGKQAAIEVGESPEPVDLGEIVLEPGERVEGIVLGRDGQPLEGVEIRVEESGPAMVFMMVGPGPSTEPEADATSDPGGWFVIEDLTGGARYNLALSRTGYVQKSVSAVEAPSAEPIEVAMDPASKVSGQVLDAEGEPVAGAQVSLSREQRVEMGGNVMMTLSMEGADADAEGRFLFEDQEPGRISLGAVSSGYQEAKLDHLEIPEGEDLEGIEIPLAAGAIVEGRVLAPDGRPAIGAEVREVTESPEMIRMGGQGTDGAGYYRLEGLAPGKISVEALDEDYPRVVKDLEAREGINRLDLQFEGGHEVEGRVSSTAGEPVAQAVVRLLTAGRYWGGPETTTGNDGRFVIQGVQDGQYRLRAEGEGYAPSAGDERVEVAGEPVRGVEIRLDPGGAIAGRITGLEPEEFASVRVAAEGGGFDGFQDSNVDREGNYRLEHLASGSYTVNATLSDSGRRATGQATLDPGAPETRLDLQFERGLTLSGQAVQGDEPVAGVTVYAEGIDVSHMGWSQTDTRGWFSIEGLEAGSYRVHVRNFQTGLAYNETVEVATNKEIVIELPTASVGGRVVDGTDREPLSGVTLVLENTEGGGSGVMPTHTATTDLEGRFSIRHIGDGNWKLTARLEGYAAVSLPVPVLHGKSADGLQLTMDPTEGLTLEARLPSGALPDELTVAVLDPSGGTLLAGRYATGENGRVRLSSVPPGEWELVVAAAGSAASNLRAPAPGPSVAVPLQPACGLSIVVPELGGSTTVATVSILGADGRPYTSLGWSGQPRREWRMSGGRAELGTLPPGAWTVRVTAPDGRNWQAQAVTSPGATATVELD